MMNRFMLIVASSFVLVLSACGGALDDDDNSPPPKNQLAGTYNGDMSETVSDFFSLLTFTVDNAGNLAGTTTAKGVGKAPKDEKGTMTGTVKITGTGIVGGDITLESPSLGRFTVTGMQGLFDGQNMTLGSGSVRDASGTFRGTSGPLIAKKE